MVCPSSPGCEAVGAIDELVAELEKLPGIGRKTAQRLTYHLLQQPKERLTRLAGLRFMSRKFSSPLATLMTPASVSN